MVPYIVIRGIEASIDRRFVSETMSETGRDEMRCDDPARARLAVCVHRADERGVNRGRVDRVCASTARVSTARATKRTSDVKVGTLGDLGVGVEDGVKTRSSRASEDGDVREGCRRVSSAERRERG